MNQTSNRIHPLMAGAAASVMLVSLLGAAAIAGILPNSHSTTAEPAHIASQSAEVIPAVAVAPIAKPLAVVHKTVVHHQYVQHSETPARQYAVKPTYQQTAPVAQNSPVGIGVGAVVGGILGNQVGKGNGRTLATIAGALGGGYVGNEIAKRNQ